MPFLGGRDLPSLFQYPASQILGLNCSLFDLAGSAVLIVNRHWGNSIFGFCVLILNFLFLIFGFKNNSSEYLPDGKQISRQSLQIIM